VLDFFNQGIHVFFVAKDVGTSSGVWMIEAERSLPPEPALS
jgi:hypothetical protein